MEHLISKIADISKRENCSIFLGMGLILSMKNKEIKEIKNMEVMYMNAGDKNIAVRKVYAKADGVAYAESTFKTKLTPDELEDAFYKGMVVIDAAGVAYRPISCKVASKVVTVTYATTDTTPTAAKLATVKAE